MVLGECSFRDTLLDSIAVSISLTFVSAVWVSNLSSTGEKTHRCKWKDAAADLNEA